jgi:hypothetical protein
MRPFCRTPPMRSRVVSLALAFAAMPYGACGGSADGVASGGDAGGEAATIAVPLDASRRDTAPPKDAKTSWARLQPHGSKVMPEMRLQIVYLTDQAGNGAPSFDAFVGWLLGSGYWQILQQYGVGPGSLVGSIKMSGASVIPASLVRNGLITTEDLDVAIHDAIHPPTSSDAGANDAADGGDASATPLIPLSDTYLFFLPDGINVSFGERGGHVFQTCIDAGGYHAYDGVEPYAVIPPCTFGHSPLAVSHELAEMATDPYPGIGWFSDKEVDNSGGEIADLCNQVVPGGVEGWPVTQLWSNADGDCEPN